MDTLKKLGALVLAFFVGYAPATWAAYRFTDPSNVRVGGIDDSGNADFDGSVTAASFSGDGSALTNLPAGTPGDGTVTTAKLATDAVTNPKVITGAVDSRTVQDASLTTGDMAFDPIEESELASLGDLNTQLGTSIADGPHTVDTTLSGSAAGGDLGGTYPNPTVTDDSHNHGDSTVSDTLTIGAGSTVADGALSANVSLLGSTIGTAEIENSAVTTAKLATDAVDSSKILNGTVAEVDLAFDPATQSELNTHEGNASAHHTKTTDASELTSGTLPDARLSANVTQLGSSIGSGEIETGAVGATELASTGVTASSYGSASAVATFTVDADGRITTAGSTSISITESQISDLGSYQPADADLDDLADGELTLSKVQYWQAPAATASICTTAPGATPQLILSTDDYDLYSATGTAVGQWRNTRTGAGPC